MNMQPALAISEEIQSSLAKCGFTLLETQAMPYEWLRLKLGHKAKAHPFELDYDGTTASLINSVEYCGDIIDGVLAKNIADEERKSMRQVRKDLVALAETLRQDMRAENHSLR